MTATADRGTITDAAREVAATAAANAEVTDREARFPAEAVAGLGASGLLGAAAPADLGGLGCDLTTLVRIASVLARGCGSTAMIWAMHQLQLACVVRHGGPGRPRAQVADLVRDRRLIASVTSEVGVGGNIGASVAAVTVAGERRSLTKQATTVSYGMQAGAFLVTARRDPEAAAGDQVAVLLDRDTVHCERTGRWNPMGMRGTDSPAMLLRAEFDPDCVLPTPFSDIAAGTMVPLSHLLWAGVWAGLATEAYERARRLARARHRTDPRIAAADEVLSGIEARIDDAARQYEPYYTGDDSPPLRLSARLNALKTAVSGDAVRVAELALESCGMAGYQEEGDHSVARLLRDLYSARLMVANDRLLAANAATLLTVRRD